MKVNNAQRLFSIFETANYIKKFFIITLRNKMLYAHRVLFVAYTLKSILRVGKLRVN